MRKTKWIITWEVVNVFFFFFHFFLFHLMIDMYPVGSIIQKENETIEINCTLDSPAYTINDLKFAFSAQKMPIQPEYSILVISFSTFFPSFPLIFFVLFKLNPFVCFLILCIDDKSNYKNVSNRGCANNGSTCWLYGK